MNDKAIDLALKVLAPETRRVIISIIRDHSSEPFRACKNKAVFAREIAERLDLDPSTISYHITQPKNAGIALETRDGIWVRYALNRENISAVCAAIRKIVGEDH